MTWKEKLRTLTSKWHPERDELSTVATTGDYNDLINAPQGGGGGSNEKKPIIINYNLNDFTNYYEQNLNSKGVIQSSMNFLENNITQEQFSSDLNEDVIKKFLYSSTINIGYSLDDQRRLCLTNPLNIQLRSSNENEECIQYPYKQIRREENNEYQDYICFKNDFNLNENIDFEITMNEIFSIEAPIVLDTFSNNDLEETEEGYIYEINFNQESEPEPEPEPGAGR